MKCPQCHNDMQVKNEDVSFNYATKPTKQYKRVLYWCEKDDVYISIETPIINNTSKIA